MPREPRFSASVVDMPEAVFSPLEARLRSHRGPLFPLHVGDTWLEPFAGARMQDLDVEAHPGMHRYSDTRGLPALREAILDKVRARNLPDATLEQVLVVGGATAGLAAALGAVADPGDEVLILAPYWPLIRGIVQVMRARPVEVPFYDRVDGPEAAVEALRERRSPRAVALYVSTPSNPTGRVLSAPILEAVAEWARREGLWLLSDEVYEELVYRGRHVSIGRFAPERTLSVFSFSKSFGMAGNRTGYLVGPEPALAQARKVGTHTVYAAPTAGQLAALRALREGGAWLERTRELYRATGDAAAQALELPPPEGGTFLFLDVRRRLDERGLWGLLEDCLDQGVLLAPGTACGAGYGGWVRLCFTSAPPDDVAEAVRRLAKLLG
jgi:N-succinyldiaminopimelate aminotransferase